MLIKTEIKKKKTNKQIFCGLFCSFFLLISFFVFRLYMLNLLIIETDLIIDRDCLVYILEKKTLNCDRLICRIGNYPISNFQFKHAIRGNKIATLRSYGILYSA